MKNQLLLASAILSFATLTCKAQITITTADMPVPGTSITTVDDSTYTGSSGTVGANQAWDYSALANTGTSVTNFVAASGQPGYANFNSSNLCAPSPADSVWQYATSDATGFYIDGIYNTGSSFPVPEFHYNPAYQLIALPAVYNGTSSHLAKANVTFAYSTPPVDSIRSKQQIQQDALYDAWGTLTTPAGTYTVLRQKMTQIATDTVEYYAFGMWNSGGTPTVDTTIYYRWWSNTEKYPVLEITETPANGVQGATYIASAGVGIRENMNTSFGVITYPNPAQNEVNFVLPAGEGSLSIIDMTGREITNKVVTGGNITIDVSAYKNGTYLFRYLSKDEKVLNGKIVIAN